MAMICVTCSAENFPAQPLRGESLKNRSSVRGNTEGFSLHSTKTKRSKACAHRRRQTPTMWRSQPTCSAMASLLSPSKAKTIMRARCATP